MHGDRGIPATMKDELFDKATDVVGAATQAVAELAQEGRSLLADHDLLPARYEKSHTGRKIAIVVGTGLIIAAGLVFGWMRRREPDLDTDELEELTRSAEARTDGVRDPIAVT